MRNINLIVIHCSATPNGVYVSPAQIDSWHAKRGFKREPRAVARFQSDLPHIGYHKLISVEGTIFDGRNIEEVGAHVTNYNASSIGICMVGTDRFYLNQWQALNTALFQVARHLNGSIFPSITKMLSFFEERGIRIVGHRDLSPDIDGDGKVEPREWLKTCPGFDVSAWLERGMQPLSVQIIDHHSAIACSNAAVRVSAKDRL